MENTWDGDDTLGFNFGQGCAVRDNKSSPSPKGRWSLKIDPVPDLFLKLICESHRLPKRLYKSQTWTSDTLNYDSKAIFKIYFWSF